MAHHDLIIIGSGSGNSLLTPELEGLDVALVEDGVFGGTCLNVGCIPTKMFVVPADRILDGVDATRLGVSWPGPAEVDWPAVRDRIFGRIDPISAAGEDYRRGQPDVTLYRTHARFCGPRTLTLATGEELTADRVVVAAGSRPAGLPIPGLEAPAPEHGLHTSDTVMRLEELPERMIVLGGGFVACELAGVFAAFGVSVTQVQRSVTLLRAEEPELGRRFTAAVRARYDVRTGAQVTWAERGRAGWRIGLDDGSTLSAEVVLMAVGRHPNADRLDPAVGGLEVHDDGRLVVDDELRTTADGVWALGDVCSRQQLKHVANHQARVVAHNLAVDLGRLPGPPRKLDGRPIPHAVFGHPQVAAFGPTSTELDAAGTPYVTKQQAYGDIAYGWALEDTTGVLIVHASPDGQILAAHCLGPHAASLIQPLIQAASFGQHAHDVARDQYWIHPAMPELVENALLGLELKG